MESEEGKAHAMKRVYLASPYAGDVERNVRYAIRALADCLAREEAPFAPHLLYTLPGVLVDGDPDQRSLGMDAGDAWAKVADALVVYADLGISSGMDQEICDARARRQTVEYRSIGVLE